MGGRRIAILLMAGALGGAGVMRVWDKPQTPGRAPVVARVAEVAPVRVSTSAPATVVAEPPSRTVEPEKVKPVIRQQRVAPKAAQKAVAPRRFAPAIAAATQPARGHDALLEFLAGRQTYGGNARAVEFTDGGMSQSPVVILQVVIVQSGGTTLQYRVTAANPFSDNFDLIDLLKQVTDTVSVKRSSGRGRMTDSFRDW
jgi:hypothetical protein